MSTLATITCAWLRQLHNQFMDLRVKPSRVNLAAVFSLVGNVASVTFAAWRGLFALDMVALADAGNREDFDDMEFLVTRALG